MGWTDGDPPGSGSQVSGHHTARLAGSVAFVSERVPFSDTRPTANAYGSPSLGQLMAPSAHPSLFRRRTHQGERGRGFKEGAQPTPAQLHNGAFARRLHINREASVAARAVVANCLPDPISRTFEWFCRPPDQQSGRPSLQAAVPDTGLFALAACHAAIGACRT